MAITVEHLKDAIHYDPKSGAFTWSSRIDQGRSWNAVHAGKTAGAHFRNKQGDKANSYIRISINKQPYFAHRLAWLWMTGEWPNQLIDHVNGDGTDNRWSNLRAATHSQNAVNQRVRSTNRHGLKGVSRQKKKWVAYINAGGVQQILGRFDCIEDAVKVRREAEDKEYGGFAWTPKQLPLPSSFSLGVEIGEAA